MASVRRRVGTSQLNLGRLVGLEHGRHHALTDVPGCPLVLDDDHGGCPVAISNFVESRAPDRKHIVELCDYAGLLHRILNPLPGQLTDQPHPWRFPFSTCEDCRGKLAAKYGTICGRPEQNHPSQERPGLNDDYRLRSFLRGCRRR